MSEVSDAEARRRLELERAPDVYFILLNDPIVSSICLGPLYAVLLPQDAGRFRVWDDANGFDVQFRYRGRYRSVFGVWRQLKKEGLDPADSRPVSVVTFGREVLLKQGAKEWKP